MDLQRILSGNISKKELNRIYFPMLGLILVMWTIARTLYSADGPYLLNFYPISRQGNVVLNPIGAWFFIIGTTIVSMLLIPYLVYIYRQLHPTMKPIAHLMRFMGVIGALGLMLVALFPEGTGPVMGFIHGTGSFMAFSGLGLVVTCTFFIMIRRIIQKEAWPTIPQFFNLYLPVFFFGSIFFFTEGSVMQWTGFSMIFIWCAGMYFILPENIN
jgi:hypothetical protein